MTRLAIKRAYAVCINHGCKSHTLCQLNYLDIVFKGFCAGVVLEKRASAADKQLCVTHFSNNCKDVKTVDAFYPVFSAHLLWIFCKCRYANVGVNGFQIFYYGDQQRVIAHISKSIIAGEKNVAVFFMVVGVEIAIDLQAILCHFCGRIIFLYYFSVSLSNSRKISSVHIKQSANVLKKKLFCGTYTASATEIGGDGNVHIFFREKTDVSLVSCNHNRLCGTHCLKHGTGNTYENIAHCDEFVNVGSSARHMHEFLAKFRICFVGKGAYKIKVVSAAHQHYLKIVVPSFKLGGNMAKHSCNGTSVRIHSADIYDGASAVGQAKLCHLIVAIYL